MRIEYKVGYLDYLVFNIVQQFLNPLVQGFFVLLSLFFFWGETTTNPVAVGLLSTLLVYVVAWMVQFVFLAVFLFTRRDDSVLTNHVVEVRDDALYEATKFNESRHFWPGVLRVVQRHWFVAVYVSQRTAHLIPTRAFQSKTQLQQFVDLIRAKKGAG